MKREELIWEWSDALDAGFKVYDMAQANEVMDELEKRIKELEEQLENVQSSTYAENVDASMALIKANERIKKLEDENALLRLADTDNTARFNALKEFLEELKKKAPKWISVKDRLPDEKDQYKLLWVAYVRTDNTIKYMYEASFDYKTKQFYTENDWGDKTFIEPSIWMVIPPPPTTEESSATEKEACDAETQELQKVRLPACFRRGGGFGETSGKLSAYIKELQANNEWLERELKQTEVQDEVVIDTILYENKKLRCLALHAMSEVFCFMYTSSEPKSAARNFKLFELFRKFCRAYRKAKAELKESRQCQ